MNRKPILIIIFLLCGTVNARAEGLQLPVPGIQPSAVSVPATNISRGISCQPIDIRAILEDVKPQKIDMEHLRNYRITCYSV